MASMSIERRHNHDRILNHAVKRNIERFPENFMFQFPEEEPGGCIA